MDYLPSRPVDRDKADAELVLNIKKATSPDDVNPKQKHVRKCIVYTWDYHTSQAIWNGLKVQPILTDEVQAFKALIIVHKLLCQGHPITLQEAQAHIGWLETCARAFSGNGSRGYGTLIRAYVDFLLAKLRYHKIHPEFNGIFEYEEYLSLKLIDDPNEGYETINDLMNLQDQIDSFQKLIFAHIRYPNDNKCRIAALVPLVDESYGIYKFIVSMLRAMHRRTDSIDALSPLRARFNAQHYGLLRFYFECSNLPYLTSLISVPKLPQDPPNLIDSGAPPLPGRPIQEQPRPPTPPAQDSSAADSRVLEEQARQQAIYEEEQRRLQQEREAEVERQQILQQQQQREFDEMQRLQAERERQAYEQLLREQMQRQAEGRVLELEREIFNIRGQMERDQLLLSQYDKRVKQLENDMQQLTNNAQQQLFSKDEMIKTLQDQILTWKNKYEALAKLYSQLRQEHLDLLSKHKTLQLKANSAQEAIDKMEKLERDMKAKNLELANLIRERDRAKYDLDKLKSSQNNELERLKRELEYARDSADSLAKSNRDELSRVLSHSNQEISDLQTSLRVKQATIDDLLHEIEQHKAEESRLLSEKDEELAILQSGMDQTLIQLADHERDKKDAESIYDNQIDTILLDHVKKLNDILDSIFENCIQKIDDSVYELESPVQTGNLNSTPEYTLSMIEKAISAVTEFSAVMSRFFGSGNNPDGSHTDVIKCAIEFAQTVADVLINEKGITRLSDNDNSIDQLIKLSRRSAEVSKRLFSSLFSFRISSLSVVQRSEMIVRNNLDIQTVFKELSDVTEGFYHKTSMGIVTNSNWDVGDLVELAMRDTALAVNNATEKLKILMAESRNVSASELQVHESILAAAMAIMTSIAQLIKAATASQQEIVTQGRGSSSNTAFYKKNNRWTEGLISAARAVALATNMLIDTADGVINGRNSFEQLIVASNEVSAATAQIVAASRVKASFMSKTQTQLETASKGVTDACKALVRLVTQLAAKQNQDKIDHVDYSKMASHEFKVKEMEQQVEILKLEKQLTEARRCLGEMRKVSYHQED